MSIMVDLNKKDALSEPYGKVHFEYTKLDKNTRLVHGLTLLIDAYISAINNFKVGNVEDTGVEIHEKYSEKPKALFLYTCENAFSRCSKSITFENNNSKLEVLLEMPRKYFKNLNQEDKDDKYTKLSIEILSKDKGVSQYFQDTGITGLLDNIGHFDDYIKKRKQKEYGFVLSMLYRRLVSMSPKNFKDKEIKYVEGYDSRKSTIQVITGYFKNMFK